MGIGSARALGRRHPLILVDVNEIRLNECVERLQHDGYAVEGHSCDIVDAGQVEALGDALAKTASVCVLAHVAAIGNTPQGWQHLLDMDLLGAHRIVDRQLSLSRQPGGSCSRRRSVSGTSTTRSTRYLAGFEREAELIQS